MKEVVTYRFVLSAFIQVFTCMCIPFHTLQSNIYLFFIYFVCVAHGEGWGILSFFWGGGGFGGGCLILLLCDNAFWACGLCIPRQDYWNVVLFFIRIHVCCDPILIPLSEWMHILAQPFPPQVFIVSAESFDCVNRLSFAVNWDAQWWSQLSPIDVWILFCFYLFSFMLLKKAVVLVSVFSYLDM